MKMRERNGTDEEAREGTGKEANVKEGVKKWVSGWGKSGKVTNIRDGRGVVPGGWGRRCAIVRKVNQRKKKASGKGECRW